MTLVDSAIHFGFITTVEIEGMGWCGGMLLLNQVARPLEFHCTLPIKPSRSQEILYGTSLLPFLCGQVIGKALLEKAKTRPHLVITDCRHTADLTQCCSTPVILHQDTSGDSSQDDRPSELNDFWQSLQVGDQAVSLYRNDQSADKDVRQWLEQYGSKNEFAEPFERIRQAILEAHQVARKSA